MFTRCEAKGFSPRGWIFPGGDGLQERDVSNYLFSRKSDEFHPI
jgi:hypothetical protein